MTYIVTGAAGFVGANIVQALNARGEKILLQSMTYVLLISIAI